MATFAEIQRDNPMRPLDWRWQRAEHLVDAGKNHCRHRDDEATGRAVEFLRRRRRCTSPEQADKLGCRMPDIAAAQRLHATGGMLATIVQARILARQSVSDIAQRVALDTTAMAAELSAAGYYEHGGTCRIRSNEKEESEMIQFQSNGKFNHDGASAESTEDRANPTAPHGQDVEGHAGAEARPDQSTDSEVPPDDRNAPSGNGEFRILVERANGGDAEAQTRLKEILDSNPAVWQKICDLAAHSRLTLIRLIANGNQLLFESLGRAAEKMEADLLGDEPTPLEQMLSERVIACWLQLQHADTVSVTVNDNLAQAKFWSQERDRAHRRYLSAVKTLTTTRQLLSAGGASRKAKRHGDERGQQTPDSHNASENGKPRSADSNGTKARKERPGAAKATKEEYSNGSVPKSMNGHTANRIFPFADSVAAK